MRATRGRVGLGFGQIPIVLVTVRGARSGIERKVPLLYFTDGDDVILIASSYGKAKFPAWYYNIKANPEVRSKRWGARAPTLRARSTARTATACSSSRSTSTAATASTTQRTEGIRRIPVMRLAQLGTRARGR